VEVPGAFKAFLYVTCHKWKPGFYEDPQYGAETRLPVTIHCMATDYQPPRTKSNQNEPAVPDPPIESVSVLAEPAETLGKQCPVNVTFRGKITADANSEVHHLQYQVPVCRREQLKSDWIPVSGGTRRVKDSNLEALYRSSGEQSSGTLKRPGE
jgi:hypothetical protein